MTGYILGVLRAVFALYSLLIIGFTVWLALAAIFAPESETDFGADDERCTIPGCLICMQGSLR